MNVILPQNTKSQIGMEGKAVNENAPVLYLLHGLSDDHSIWLRRTSVERYVSELGLAVVMPAVARSFYCDMKHGLKYWSFISDELPKIVQSFFHVSPRREDNFVAGLSMGGYGAFKLAMAKPENYAAAISLSGALDAEKRVKVWKSQEMTDIFGDKVTGTENDLFHLAKKVSKLDSGQIPALFQSCGTEDFLIDENRAFKKHADKLGLKIDYEEKPGVHDWAYWDKAIVRSLQWLVRKKLLDIPKNPR